MNKKIIAPMLITVAAVYLSWRMLRKGSSTPSLINTDTDMRCNTILPRGYRNNNPLNIRINAANNWQGKVVKNTDRSFEQFISMQYGYRAALVLLRKYINSYGCNTIAKIISRWAPPTENNTNGYINSVCGIITTQLGKSVTPGTIVNASDKTLLCDMAYAMSIVENGNTDVTRAAGLPNMDIIKQGWNLI